ncbi:hypothetical protein [Nissabacter sp. SGAir0207]|uniref:hypothetical protein n=1 Tax=Nissabacter sp. SGAir0207 TaxID=2126321 RepID=UPI0010CD0AF6|nr:hypothetical protein [Nissabacter sp. SGAir0207]QCR37990.1 hypothetical protein C1N62_17770 [Nissabacter sp. SGAir0207]
MVKRREPPVVPVEKKIEAFAAQADNSVAVAPSQDKDAKRDYKAIRVPFNEYEFAQLEALCEKTQRSKLNMIRYALAFYAEHGLNELS